MLYSYLDSSTETWKSKSNIEFGGHAEKSDKTNETNKRLQFRWEIIEINNYFNKMVNERWSDGNFQNELMGFLVLVDIFSIKSGNLLSRQISKTKPTNQLDFLC